MKNFKTALKIFKVNAIGAACFQDQLTNTKHCANGLTQQEAENFALLHNLVLLNWQAGQKCSNINC
jgi:hypothetical protein